MSEEAEIVVVTVNIIGAAIVVLEIRTIAIIRT